MNAAILLGKATHRGRYTGLKFILASIFFTLAIWAWMLIQPGGTFHDQGGLMISLVFFPLTFLVWLVCSLGALIQMIRRRRELLRFNWFLIIALILEGLLLSFLTLLIA